ncbi:hypothetical protein FAI40_08770 [Acetobacteraceae bacterium]|nr:hypothetical protein FAI40_08770 [Acetobacteraceae bacterium]
MKRHLKTIGAGVLLAFTMSGCTTNIFRPKTTLIYEDTPYPCQVPHGIEFGNLMDGSDPLALGTLDIDNVFSLPITAVLASIKAHKLKKELPACKERAEAFIAQREKENEACLKQYNANCPRLLYNDGH